MTNTRLRNELRRARFASYRPPPDLTVSQWAERSRVLSSEASAETGPWQNSRNPMLVAPMDALSPQDPCERVVGMFSSQIGKTEIGLNFCGYQIDMDPGPMLVVQPTKMPMGETFAKDRIRPMLRDSPTLSKKFTGVRQTDGGNTIYHKVYPGGQLTIAGANSPSQLASRPIRYLFVDEVDRNVVTKEGNALLQARARQKAFHNSKELITSSPSFENVGIHFEYQQCLQHEWRLQCTGCGEKTFPAFKHFVFKRDDFGNACDVNFVCPECGVCHDETEEGFLKATASWVVINDLSPRYKGYHANQFGSPFVAWRDTVQEFLDAKDDPERLQVVVNTAFAELWRGAGEHLDVDVLRKRREVYPMNDDGELLVPEPVQKLFMTVDTQDTWLDCQVYGVNSRFQSWGMERLQLFGNTDEEDVWDQLEDQMAKVFETEDGRGMPIFATMIDIKGHRQDKVVSFCHAHRFLRVYGYAGQASGAKDQIGRTKKKMEDGTRKKINVYNVRTDDFKRKAMTYMNRDAGKMGACHWPIAPDQSDIAGYDREHFEQECAETMEVKTTNGHQTITFRLKRKRNEAFDQRQMLYALIQISNPRWLRDTTVDPERTDRRASAPAPKPISPPVIPEGAPKRTTLKRRKVPGKWMNGG